MPADKVCLSFLSYSSPLALLILSPSRHRSSLTCHTEEARGQEGLQGLQGTTQDRLQGQSQRGKEGRQEHRKEG